ncbi:hypothetical protein [Coleofasciculus sp. H7-2]
MRIRISSTTGLAIAQGIFIRRNQLDSSEPEAEMSDSASPGRKRSQS